jgi:hypothetical protein
MTDTQQQPESDSSEC